ncbi:hypothetical protein V1477_000864 [Vespula maculifrons]|uniref:Uncharacterized protein n=1 Tax=Vespula maculifrons TaxID=7453 RepID=A0ABD2D060_VESMC
MGRVIFERISMSPGNILRDPISSWCSSLKKSGQSPQSCIKDLIVRRKEIIDMLDHRGSDEIF